MTLPSGPLRVLALLASAIEGKDAACTLPTARSSREALLSDLLAVLTDAPVSIFLPEGEANPVLGYIVHVMLSIIAADGTASARSLAASIVLAALRRHPSDGFVESILPATCTAILRALAVVEKLPCDLACTLMQALSLLLSRGLSRATKDGKVDVILARLEAIASNLGVLAATSQKMLQCCTAYLDMMLSVLLAIAAPRRVQGAPSLDSGATGSLDGSLAVQEGRVHAVICAIAQAIALCQGDNAIATWTVGDVLQRRACAFLAAHPHLQRAAWASLHTLIESEGIGEILSEARSFYSLPQDACGRGRREAISKCVVTVRGLLAVMEPSLWCQEASLAPLFNLVTALAAFVLPPPRVFCEVSSSSKDLSKLASQGWAPEAVRCVAGGDSSLSANMIAILQSVSSHTGGMQGLFEHFAPAPSQGSAELHGNASVSSVYSEGGRFHCLAQVILGWMRPARHASGNEAVESSSRGGDAVAEFALHVIDYLIISFDSLQCRQYEETAGEASGGGLELSYKAISDAEEYWATAWTSTVAALLLSLQERQRSKDLSSVDAKGEHSAAATLQATVEHLICPLLSLQSWPNAHLAGSAEALLLHVAGNGRELDAFLYEKRHAIVDQIASAIRLPLLYPRAPATLKVFLAHLRERLSGPTAMNIASIADVLGEMSENAAHLQMRPGYVTLLLEAFTAILSIEPPHSDSDGRGEEEEIARREAGATNNEDKEAATLDAPPNVRQQLYISIARLAVHFVSDDCVSIRLAALAILRQSFASKERCKDSFAVGEESRLVEGEGKNLFLPLLHHTWGPLLARIQHDPEDCVVVASLLVLRAQCSHGCGGGDFLRDRIVQDLIPTTLAKIKRATLQTGNDLGVDGARNANLWTVVEAVVGIISTLTKTPCLSLSVLEEIVKGILALTIAATIQGRNVTADPHRDPLTDAKAATANVSRAAALIRELVRAEGDKVWFILKVRLHSYNEPFPSPFSMEGARGALPPIDVGPFVWTRSELSFLPRQPHGSQYGREAEEGPIPAIVQRVLSAI